MLASLNAPASVVALLLQHDAHVDVQDDVSALHVTILCELESVGNARFPVCVYGVERQYSADHCLEEWTRSSDRSLAGLQCSRGLAYNGQSRMHCLCLLRSL